MHARRRSRNNDWFCALRSNTTTLRFHSSDDGSEGARAAQQTGGGLCMGTVGGFPRPALGAIRAQPPGHGKRHTGIPRPPYAPAASDATQTKRTPRKCMRDITTSIDFLNQNENSINLTTCRSNFPPGRGATRAPRDGDFHDMTGPSEPVLYKTDAFTLRKGISVLPLTRVTIERICHG